MGRPLNDLLAALGLMLAIEGICVAAFPTAWRKALFAVLTSPETPLRLSGLAIAVVGVLVVWLARG